MKFQDLGIVGGYVTGRNPNVAARGGGMLIDGGNVTLSDVTVAGNAAAGATGTAGTQGQSGHGSSAP